MLDSVCAHFKDLGDYDYRPAREVAEGDENTEVRSVIEVDILGHIFEQSITDLERLREGLVASPALGTLASSPASEHVEAPPAGTPALPVAGKTKSRRKQEGAVYTSAFITRYIVGQALGGVLKQRFEALRQQHEAEAAGTARKVLADPKAKTQRSLCSLLSAGGFTRQVKSNQPPFPSFSLFLRCLVVHLSTTLGIVGP